MRASTSTRVGLLAMLALAVSACSVDTADLEQQVRKARAVQVEADRQLPDLALDKPAAPLLVPARDPFSSGGASSSSVAWDAVHRARSSGQ